MANRLREGRVYMQKLWSRALPLLCQRVGERNFQAWIEPIHCEVEEDGVRLEVPSRFFQEWLTRHFLRAISNVLAELNGSPCVVRLVVNEAVTAQARVAALGEAAAVGNGATNNGARLVVNGPALPSPKIGRLVPHYTFDNFVVGPSNEVAFKAAQAISAAPGRRFNPVFVYGGVGLGKTHLINAIAHDLLTRSRRIRLACLSAEAFMNVLISSLRHDRMNGFRDRFREVDALILDDIQFLAGKERTQEEFFHTFNALHGGGRQIVLTSDKAPMAINGLEHRLRSRFEGGLIADIHPPTFEMRLAILQAKATRQGVELSPEVAQFLARMTGPSVRELEGTLNRLSANAGVRGLPITLSLAEEVVGPLLPPRSVSVEAIQDAVSRRFGLSIADLKSERRGREVTLPRQIAMYLSRTLAAASFPSIAEKFERDHSTVMHAVRVIEARRAADANLAHVISDLDNELRESGQGMCAASWKPNRPKNGTTDEHG
jgi:chromosomal replication initiator protein